MGGERGGGWVVGGACRAPLIELCLERLGLFLRERAGRVRHPSVRGGGASVGGGGGGSGGEEVGEEAARPLHGEGALELLDLRADALLRRLALGERVVEGVVELLRGVVGVGRGLARVGEGRKFSLWWRRLHVVGSLLPGRRRRALALSWARRLAFCCRSLNICVAPGGAGGRAQRRRGAAVKEGAVPSSHCRLTSLRARGPDRARARCWGARGCTSSVSSGLRVISFAPFRPDASAFSRTSCDTRDRDSAIRAIYWSVCRRSTRAICTYVENRLQ